MQSQGVEQEHTMSNLPRSDCLRLQARREDGPVPAAHTLSELRLEEQRE